MIKRRPFQWRRFDPDSARVAAAYAIPGLEAVGSDFLLPDDGINHFLDCDLWVVVSDRLSMPLLPARPCVMVVHDYIQRYGPIVDGDRNLSFLAAAHKADRVLVTSRFTLADAMQYAGLPKEKLRRLPLILPRLNDDPPVRPTVEDAAPISSGRPILPCTRTTPTPPRLWCAISRTWTGSSTAASRASERGRSPVPKFPI